MTVYNRQANTVCAASNNSILSVYDLGDPQLDLAVNITALHLAVGWLLNYTAASLPAESSINFWFWFAPSGTYSSLWEINAYTTLQSMLAFILWEFCTNNNENPAVAPEQSGGQPVLPSAFQTTASICQPYTKFVLNSAMFITYIILKSFALAFCWTVIVWQCFSHHRHPEISSYPLVDFASKLQERLAVDGACSLSLHPSVSLKSGDKAIRHSLTKTKIIVARYNSDFAEPEAGLSRRTHSKNTTTRGSTPSPEQQEQCHHSDNQPSSEPNRDASLLVPSPAGTAVSLDKPVRTASD